MKQKKLDIIYEDKFIIVVNKPSGLLTISNNHEKIKTLYHEVLVYEKKKNPKNKIFIVHRLDKDTSGIVLFSKNENLKHELQENWNAIAKREYYALVHGIPIKEKDTLINYLYETKTLETIVTNDKRRGKLSITNYEVIKKCKDKSLLKINIETGRKNQIRVSLSNIGHPIIGDKKYGIKGKEKHLYLHASSLEILINGKQYKFESKLPKYFDKYY